jgi:invasion protein IalB
MLGGLLLAASALAQRPAAPAPAAPAPAPAAPTPAAQAPAPAAPAPQAAPAARSWTVTCAEAPPGTPRDCQISAQVVLQPQNQPLARVIVARQPETRSLGLVFQLPHGAALPAGMAWQLDEAEPQVLAFQTSDASGLYAGVPVADDLLAGLRRATTLRLSFVVAARREQLVMPIPLAGFGEAVTEFLAAERGAAR